MTEESKERSRRISPYEALKSLPAVFDIRDLEIGFLGTVQTPPSPPDEAPKKNADGTRIKTPKVIARKPAYNTVTRWLAGGHIRQFSAGVYFNLVVAPDPSAHIVDAIEKTAPMVAKALVGASALHHGGWTTQMPSGYELVLANNSYARTWKRMDGVKVELRPRRWFSAVLAHLETSDIGLPILPPAMALVDSIVSREELSSMPRDERKERMLTDRTIWHPDPDDICLPHGTPPAQALALIDEAVELLGADREAVARYVAAIPDFEGDGPAAGLGRGG